MNFRRIVDWRNGSAENRHLPSRVPRPSDLLFQSIQVQRPGHEFGAEDQAEGVADTELSCERPVPIARIPRHIATVATNYGRLFLPHLLRFFGGHRGLNRLFPLDPAALD